MAASLCTLAGSNNHDRVTAQRGRTRPGRGRATAVDHQRRVVRRRAGMATVRRGGHVQGLRVEVLPGRRRRELYTSHVLVPHARHQARRVLYHQHLRCHGKTSISITHFVVP